MVDVPQSPVRHEKEPVECWVQWVRPHKVPEQELFMSRVLDSLGWRVKPVVGRGISTFGIQSLWDDIMAGHTV